MSNLGYPKQKIHALLLREIFPLIRSLLSDRQIVDKEVNLQQHFQGELGRIHTWRSQGLLINAMLATRPFMLSICCPSKACLIISPASGAVTAMELSWYDVLFPRNPSVLILYSGYFPRINVNFTFDSNSGFIYQFEMMKEQRIDTNIPYFAHNIYRKFSGLWDR